MIKNKIGLFGQPYSKLGIAQHCRELFRAISKKTDSDIWALFPQAFDSYDIADLKSGIKEYRGSHEQYEKGLCFWPWHSDKNLDYLNHFTVFEATRPKVENFKNVRRLSTASEWGTDILKGLNLKCEIGGVIPAGVNTDIFSDRDRDYINAPSRFLMVAKQEVRKGIDIALKAFDIVSRGYTNITLTALITDPFDPSFNIINYLKSSGIPSNGKIHLIQPPESPKEMANLYREHDVLIFPTRSEAIGLPIIEAMACGCVPVATRYSAIPEYVGNAGMYIDIEKMEDVYDPKWFPKRGELGQWAKPSLDSLVSNMVQLLENDALWLMKSGQSSARIAKLFTWENAAMEALKEINN